MQNMERPVNRCVGSHHGGDFVSSRRLTTRPSTQRPRKESTLRGILQKDRRSHRVHDQAGRRALPKNLKNADIVLAGVSRTGKTPLSIYLAQKGYKVANVPIVMGVSLPSSLFTISPRKVFGLTINPLVLQTIRKARAKTLGFADEVRTNYAEMDHVREELEHARKIFAQNPTWPVIEVTGKAIEETAAIILRLYHDRKQKCSMPRISKRY